MKTFKRKVILLYLDLRIKLSKELYDKYDSGNKLFNYDDLGEISDLLEIIKTAKIFSDESFEDTYIQMHGNFTKDDWITNLKENENVVIGKSPYELSNERLDAINLTFRTPANIG